MRRPQLIVVAGPNGVGKSTYTRTPFASGVLLVDPDRREGQRGGESPIATGRVAVRRVREALSHRENFVMETTLSGKYPLRIIEEAQRAGYAVTLLYIGVPDPDECIRRVQRRTEQGGHGVPEEDIRRRFARSLASLTSVIDCVDQVFLHDNPAGKAYRLVARSDFRTTTLVSDEIPQWAEPAIDAIRRRLHG